MLSHNTVVVHRGAPFEHHEVLVPLDVGKNAAVVHQTVYVAQSQHAMRLQQRRDLQPVASGNLVVRQHAGRHGHIQHWVVGRLSGAQLQGAFAVLVER